MARENNFNDLLCFIAVAREQSFTRAAAQLGVSQSALSHSVRTLEARLGVRLLTRTTRSVAPTEAGRRLLQTVPSCFDDIETELAAVAELRDKPAGSIRVTATDYATRTILLPRLSTGLRDYPEIKVEIITDYGLTDIVADRFDIGVRHGDQVAKDMIAVRIAPDLRMVIVGSPAYLKQRPPPKVPADLPAHSCINLRLPTHGSVYAWELKKGRRAVQVRVEGQFSFNGTYEMLDGALAGCGLAYVPADLAEPHVHAGRLRYVLEDWFPTFPGMHIYYANRRQSSRALSVVIDALRYRP
jgi:DNA-binding transcriptional LysR family regulator